MMQPQTDSRTSVRGQLELPTWFVLLLTGLFVLLVMGLGFFTFTTVKRVVADAPFDTIGGENDPLGSGGSDQVIDEGAAETIEGWDEGRVTVLIMGIDERQLEQGPWRTDTMILITVDPANKTAGMLSLPRDLWVEMPDYNGLYDRINTAHFRGDADLYPGGGGPALAMKTVQHNFGIPVDYFLSVNFFAFIQVVDRLGCVPINVPQTIDDPDYPAPEGFGFDPFYVEAGDHCMGGETLLKYVRTRATFGSDFDRAARQQDVIYAVRDHVLDTGQMPNLVAQSADIYGDVAEGVNTNLSLDQMIALARLATDIPDHNICSAVISGDYVEDLITREDGNQIIIWNRSRVRQLITDLVTNSGSCDQVVQDLAAEVAAEGALVEIVNGTTREGLATDTADRLRALGVNVESVGNADRNDYEATIIYNIGGASATARYIAQILGVPETAIVVAPPNSPDDFDIQVVLGADYGG